MINESGTQNGYVTLVKLENVSKHFEKLNIFNDLSFEIVAGQSVALLGPSGCGKTTLIRMIADLDDDYTGKISRNYRKIGYVFKNLD